MKRFSRMYKCSYEDINFVVSHLSKSLRFFCENMLYCCCRTATKLISTSANIQHHHDTIIRPHSCITDTDPSIRPPKPPKISHRKKTKVPSFFTNKLITVRSIGRIAPLTNHGKSRLFVWMIIVVQCGMLSYRKISPK
jgi:hypothetical protein